MSKVSLVPEILANVPIPSVGKYVFFVESVSKQLFWKDSTGASGAVSNSVDTFQLYPANHSTSVSTSIYTLDITGKPAPALDKSINIKVSAPNTFGNIQVVIPTVGTFNLFKAAGIPFTAGELKAGQILTIIVDSGAAYYLGGFIQSDLIPVTDTAALKALMSANSLVVGAWYQFAFTTSYTIAGAIVNAPAPETLMVLAVTTGSVSSNAISVAHPEDDIKINFNDATYGSKITYRKDNIKALTAPFDWRNVKFRRGNDPLAPSYYLLTDPTAPTFTSNFQDQYCFANSPTGSGCFNITIEPVQVNNSNAAIAPYIGWGIDNCNITITAGANIHIKNSHSIAIGAIFGSNNPANGFSLIINNSYECNLLATSSGVIENCFQVYAHGNNHTTGEGWSIHKFALKNSININLITNQGNQLVGMNNFLIDDSQNIYMQALVNGSNVNIFDCTNVWVSDSQNCEFVGVQSSAFESVQNSIYEQSTALSIVGSLQEYIVSSRNLVSVGVSGTNIETLKDAYQFRDKIANVEVVLAGTPQTIVAGTTVVSFANGDLMAISNSIALLNKATSIAFDTNADNLPDTIAYPLVVGGFQSNYPSALAAAAGNFYLIYYNGKFHLLFSAINCPYRIDVNGSEFDGMNSNFVKTINYNAGAITISDSSNYDYGHVGTLIISHGGITDQVTTINHSSGKYPNLRRLLKNATPGISNLWFNHGIGANLIAMPGSLQRQINNGNDTVEVILSGGGQWTCLRVTTSDDGSIMQRTVIPLTATQLQNLNSIPILAVPAPLAGKAIRLIDAHLVFRKGSAQYTFASTVWLQNAIVPGAISNAIPTAGGLDGTVDQVLMFSPIGGNIPLLSLAALGLFLTAGANGGAGNGTATLVVSYRIIDLP